MSGKRVKRIRKWLFNQGISICADPYRKGNDGRLIADKGRYMYQRAKREGIPS